MISTFQVGVANVYRIRIQRCRDIVGISDIQQGRPNFLRFV